MPSHRKQLIKEATRRHAREIEETEPAAETSSSSKGAASSSSSSSKSSLPGFGDQPKRYKNKTKVLVFASRGIQSRHRHLMEDLRVMLPHSKKDTKLDKKGSLEVIPAIADTFNCNGVLYFEARKKMDLYMWAALTPSGPTMKFHVTNIHTTDELKLTGNCLRGSRPLLSFDKAFEDKPHLKLSKEVLTQLFGTPKYHPRSKPFFDHVFSFSMFEGRIWFRHYQIITQELSRGKEALQMVEIGPRFVLDPIRILGGSFGGPTLFKNPDYVSPNVIRAVLLREQSEQYRQRKQQQRDRWDRESDMLVPRDPVQEIFKASKAKLDAPDVWKDQEEEKKKGKAKRSYDDDDDDDDNSDDSDEEFDEDDDE